MCVICSASIGREKNTISFYTLKSQNVYKTKQQIPNSKQQQQRNWPIPFCSLSQIPRLWFWIKFTLRVGGFVLFFWFERNRVGNFFFFFWQMPLITGHQSTPRCHSSPATDPLIDATHHRLHFHRRQHHPLIHLLEFFFSFFFFRFVILHHHRPHCFLATSTVIDSFF